MGRLHTFSSPLVAVLVVYETYEKLLVCDRHQVIGDIRASVSLKIGHNCTSQIGLSNADYCCHVTQVEQCYI